MMNLNRRPFIKRRSYICETTAQLSRIESYPMGGCPMRSTQQFSITLPHEMAEMVRTRVDSGEYASESEVIRDGLRALEMHDRALETWLREDVAAAYDAMKADPSRARSAAQVRASLAAAHKSALRAG
jgi:putative addiction module CopG family antidote